MTLSMSSLNKRRNKTVIVCKLRGITSLALLIAFFTSLFTGMGLYLAPSGRIAKAGWSFVGLGKWQLSNLHTTASFAMAAIVVVHLILNYRLLLGEVKLLLKKR